MSSDFQEKLDKWASIGSGLRKWRKERFLSVMDQKNGLIANLTEELLEYLRAKDDIERIDAMCDMLVFMINANPDVLPDKLAVDVVVETSNILPFYVSSFIAMQCSSVVVSDDMYLHTARVIKKYLDSLGDSFGFMQETLLEIQSRTGHYDYGIKKFVKDRGFYTIQEVYDFIKHSDQELRYETGHAGFPDEYAVLEESDKFIVKDCITGVAFETYRKWYKADYTKYLSKP